MAARLIAARDGVGAKRQVIFVSLGGFDNHAFLSGSHPPLLTQLAAALSAFDAALGELNVRNQVTTFTASDFGRTLASNGDGSDHGWGAHHFVLGGAVKGRDIYGQFPVVALGTNDDAGQGRLHPDHVGRSIRGELCALDGAVGCAAGGRSAEPATFLADDAAAIRLT